MLIFTALLACASPPDVSPATASPASQRSAAPAPDAGPVPPVADAGSFPPPLCEPSSLLWHDGRWWVGDNEKAKHLYTFTADPTVVSKEKLPAIGAVEKYDDIEALADGARFVVTSHGRKRNGDPDEDRRRLLDRQSGTVGAVTIAVEPGPLRDRLLAAAEKDLPNGLTRYQIEGATRAGETLLLGLRGPLTDDGQAIVLTTPLAPDAASTYPATLAATVRLDVPGAPPQGIRELVPHKAGYLIVSGASSTDDASETAEHALWFWPSLTEPARLIGRLPPSTEGIGVLPDGRLLTVQDGAKGDDDACKTQGTWKVVSLPLP